MAQQLSFPLSVARVASSQEDVRETSRNSGPEVDAYLREVGLPPGLSWCAAFVSWCVAEAVRQAGGPGGPPRFRGSGGALRLLELNSSLRLGRPSPDGPCVFVVDRGHGLGHTGFCLELRPDGTMLTVEGNTDPGGDREGDGVYARSDRRADSCAGFLAIG